MQILQPLPTASGDSATLARQLLRLLGPAYPAPNNSTNAADALALGAALADERFTFRGALDSAFPDTVREALITEWEQMLALPSLSSTLTYAQRRIALLARWRTRFAGTPDAILAALAPLSATAPTMRETLARDSHANPRRVYAFAVRTSVDPTTPAIAPLVATVAVMKPAHTAVAFTDRSLTAGFFCNDPDSLTNNTLL